MQSSPICIIPARGGSKRIPRKNVIGFNGKPMISWSINAALESGLFEDVIVSTDDPEIAGISREYGASTPFMRDAALSDDHATTAEVMIDALHRYPETKIACCLYPTAPLVTIRDLHKACTLLTERELDCVLSVTEYDFHPLRAFSRSPNGSLSFNWPEYEVTRSQDLPNLVHDAGMFYFLKTESLLNTGKIVCGSAVGVEIPRHRAVDIDTPEDLEIAKILHKWQLETGAMNSHE